MTDPSPPSNPATPAPAGGPTLVAVAPDKFSGGVYGPADDWRTKNERRVTAAYEVLELGTALAREYRASDAHFVAYVVYGPDGRPLARQPRINKSGLAWVRSQGFTVKVGLLACDVDNPGHALWTPEREKEALAEWGAWAGVGVLATFGGYHTAKGRRLLQPLVEPVTPEEAEDLLDAWFGDLEALGVPVDRSCCDWTRHHRLPHVKRDGVFARARFLDLGRMRAVRRELPPADGPDALAPAAPKAPRRAARPRSAPPPALGPLGDRWLPSAARLALAVRAEPDDWHDLFLALSGALLERGVDPGEVPRLCVAVSLATGADTKTDDRRKAAESTVARVRASEPVRGFGALVDRWPAVALALDEVLPRGGPPAPAAPPPPARTKAELQAELEGAIREAAPGLTVIEAPCGLGKTRAAELVARERADKPYVTEDAKGERAPAGSKTSLSFDKNALSLESFERLRAAGAPVERRFGALALRRDKGEPVCAYADVARPLVEGRQSLVREFCEGRGVKRCEFYDGCEARLRHEGEGRARVVVGSHGVLGELDRDAGATGLLVLDEPPGLLETESFDRDALLGALALLPTDFEPRYGAIVRPVAYALAAYLKAAPAGEGPLLRAHEALSALAPLADDELLATACRAADVERTGRVEGDLALALSAAIAPGAPSDAPPLERDAVGSAKRNLAYARRLGAASRVLSAVHRLFAGHTPGVVRVHAHEGAARALVTLPRVDLARALRRDGAVVVLDANAGVHLPVYRKLVGYEPQHVRLEAPPDGAPVERTHLYAHATRTRWMKGKKLLPSAALASVVRDLVDWALEAPGHGPLAVITFRPLKLALAVAHKPGDLGAAKAWAEDGGGPALLDALVERLRPEIGRWPGELLLGHYGGVRGLDAMKHADALATLGDPWPNLDDVAAEMAFLGLEGPWEARAEAICRAELEQAQGRLRTVHRTRPARALHVGRLRPGGAAWASPEVRERTRPGGRPKNQAAMSADEFRQRLEALGGVRAAARALGCAPSTVHAYAKGTCAVPANVAERCERARLVGAAP